MSKRLLHIVILQLMLLVVTESIGQKTYTIPDTNFRKVLLANYPQLMIGDKLDSAAAAGFSEGLELDNANISNLDGLQYFISTDGLAARNNKLTSIPELAFLTKIQRVYLNSNQLVSLPNLNALTQVIEFHVHENKLTQLPNLSNMTSLKSLYCGSNQLRSLPDFSNNSNLLVLVAGDNPIEITPDYSPLINLLELHIHQTNIKDTINGLSQLKKLIILFAWQNKITDLSALNTNTGLITFQVFQNEMKQLPNLLNKPNLSYVNFSNNLLTFKDILPLQVHNKFSGFKYNPQKKLTLPNYTQRLNDDFSLTVAIDNSLSTNSYRWFKNNQFINQTTSPLLQLNPLQFTDAGDYRVEITNNALPDLTLESNTSTLVVKPCLEIINSQFEQQLIQCGKGFDIRFNELKIEGGVAPYNYQLKKDNSVITSYDPLFTQIQPGKYSFIINDNRGEACRDTMSITVKNDRECDLVFTPNGDGVMDTYFINESGSIKIYDTSRQLVTEFVGPASWNGTDSNGQQLPSGIYAIVINDSKAIQLTLIK